MSEILKPGEFEEAPAKAGAVLRPGEFEEVAAAPDSFQTVPDPSAHTPSAAEVAQRSGELAGKIKDEAKAVGGALSAPWRGTRALGVGSERLLRGDTLSRAAERAAAAVKPDYVPIPGERKGAFLGENLGAIAATAGLGGAAVPLQTAAEAGKAGVLVGTAGRAVGLAKYAKSAAEMAGFNASFQAIDDLAAKGTIDRRDIAVSAAFGGLLGVVGAGAGDAVHLALQTAPAKAMQRMSAAVFPYIQQELQTAKFRFKRGLGIPQETGLVPVDVKQAFVEGKLGLADAARHSLELFDDSVRVQGGRVSPAELAQARLAVGREVYKMLVQSGIPPEVAGRRVFEALKDTVPMNPTPGENVPGPQMTMPEPGPTGSPAAPEQPAPAPAAPRELPTGAGGTESPPPAPQTTAPETPDYPESQAAAALGGVPAPAAPGESAAPGPAGLEPAAVPSPDSLASAARIVKAPETREALLAAEAKRLKMDPADPALPARILAEHETRIKDVTRALDVAVNKSNPAAVRALAHSLTREGILAAQMRGGGVPGDVMLTLSNALDRLRPLSEIAKRAPADMTPQEFIELNRIRHPSWTRRKLIAEHWKAIEAHQDAGGVVSERVKEGVEEMLRDDQARSDRRALKATGFQQTPALSAVRGGKRPPGLDKEKFRAGGYLGEFGDEKSIPGIWKKGGWGPDDLARNLHAAGIIPEESPNMAIEALRHEHETKSPLHIVTGPRLVEGGMSGYAARGAFASDTPALPSEFHFQPMPGVMIVKLAKALTGDWPRISRRMGADTRGLFDAMSGLIKINPLVARDPDQLAKTIAHEIGHADDWADDRFMARGNLIGRLIKATRTFLGNTHGSVTVTNKDLREELKALSAYWRPWDEASASPGFKAYRNSAKELYADALSVLINSPGTLQEMAPGFYSNFLDHLDKRPTFAKAWWELQGILNGSDEDIAKMIADDLVASTLKGDEVMRGNRMQREAREYSVAERLMFQYKDTMYQAVKTSDAAKLKGMRVSPDNDPKYVLEEAGLGNNTTVGQLGRIRDEVTGPLNAAGIDRHEINQYVAMNHFAYSRYTLEERPPDAPAAWVAKKLPVANPHGIDEKTAEFMLRQQERRLGPERWALLQERIKRFHEICWESVEKAGAVEYYDPEFVKGQAKDNMYTYAPVVNLRHLAESGRISPNVFKVIGTFEDAMGFFDAKVAKTAALNNANQYQAGKLALIKRLKEIGGEIFPTEYRRTPHGDRGAALRREGFERLGLHEKGKFVEYDIDPFMAKAFERMPAYMRDAFVDAIGLRAANPVSRALLTHLNAGFSLFTAMARYTGSGLKNRPATFGEGINPLNLIKDWAKYKADYWLRALPEARALLQRGELSPTLQKMVENFEFDVRRPGFGTDESADPTSYMMQRLGLLEPGPSQRRGIGRVLDVGGRYLDWLSRESSSLLLAHKIVGQRALEESGVAGKELAYRVRNHMGLPFTTGRKGVKTETTNEVLLFSNVLAEHWRRFREVAFVDPKTRGGYWAKSLYMDVLPTVATWMAAHGAFDHDDTPAGHRISDHYRRLSRYYRMTSAPIAVGEATGGKYGYKTSAIPWPADEGGRPIRILTYKLLDGLFESNHKHLEDIFKLGFGMLPSFAQELSIGWNWMAFLSKMQPYDFHRGRPAIPESVVRRGGWPAWKKMLEWTVDQSGQVNLSAYDPARRSTAETIVQMTPVLNRALIQTDYGLTEEDNDRKADRLRRTLPRRPRR